MKMVYFLFLPIFFHFPLRSMDLNEWKNTVDRWKTGAFDQAALSEQYAMQVIIDQTIAINQRKQQKRTHATVTLQLELQKQLQNWIDKKIITNKLQFTECVQQILKPLEEKPLSTSITMAQIIQQSIGTPNKELLKISSNTCIVS